MGYDIFERSEMILLWCREKKDKKSIIRSLLSLAWGLLNNVLRTIVEFSQRNRKLHNIYHEDHFYFRAAWSEPSMDPSNLRLVVHRRHWRLAASMLKSPSLMYQCLPSTILTIHVSLLPKVVRFTIEEFSTRNNKVYILSWIIGWLRRNE